MENVYERRMRKEEKINKKWIEMKWSKEESKIDIIKEEKKRIEGKINEGNIEVEEEIGYMELRFEGKWERKR